ncbi:hypothetical protein U9M48_016060 [Paspalum notatum var. saurae]|uniref:BLE2 protein n=1 Tax=Paspalum notatum var. saurae TaxID=547442 RepID=A0AAQ3T831_PASNO
MASEGADGAEAHEATSLLPLPQPEKKLNSFVRAVALIERLGNALGTLAFTWATVVLLGGYPTVLCGHDDFAFVTVIVFLEAARMFTRDNRMDYQLFFRSRGALGPLGWSGLTVVVMLSNAMVLLDLCQWKPSPGLAWVQGLVEALKLGLLILSAVIGKLLSPGALKLLPKPLRRATSLYSPLVAVMLLVPSIMHANPTSTKAHAVANWVVLVLLLLAVLLVTISRLRFPRVIKLITDITGLGSNKQVFWRRLILNLCLFAGLVMLVLIHQYFQHRIILVAFQIHALLSVLAGNLQIPTAGVRVLLTMSRLVPHNYNSDEHHPIPSPESMVNLVPSLDIFYGMVLAQGTLYLTACVAEVFSSIPRRSLARCGGFRGQRGAQSVNLYYRYALEKWMERDVLAAKQISLISFAMDSINSDSPNLQLLAVWMMHNLLRKEPTRTQLLSKLHTSRYAIARLINMLEWKDTTIRLFAAKIIDVLAKSLRVISIPGAVQAVFALLNVDSDHQYERGTPLQYFADDDDDDQGMKRRYTVTTDATSTVIQEERHVVDSVLYVHSSPPVQRVGIMQQQVSILHDEQNSCVLIRWWRWISEFWSVLQEEPLTDHDILPVLGMSIIGSLASYDQSSCMKISKAKYIIPEIIKFTCCCRNNGMQNTNKVQQKILMRTSLKLLGRLSSISGEIGTVLRHMIAKHPDILVNLAAILDDKLSTQDFRKLSTGIIRNLATDSDTSQKIGRIKVIISRMMGAFLTLSAHTSTNPDRHLQKVSGQALVMLTIDCADNCAAILMESENVIGEITSMVCENKHVNVAANLLQNLLLHIKPESLTNLKLRELLCSTLPKIFGSIMHTKGDELEVLIGLSSQICRIFPEEFARELENSQRKETFLKRLVDTLGENMNPDVHCPRIRRVTVEQTIYLMKYSSYYANFFSQLNMMEALLKVEQTPSRVEMYRVFFGNEGLLEHKEPLTNLVATAKELMCCQWLRDVK